MTKILSAYLSRLWKDKFFWLAMLFMAGFGVFRTLNQYNNQQLLQQRGLVETTDLALEQYCFFFQWVIGGVAALVSSLFLGLEYQDGTLRNKLIAGHSRTSVYLAGLIINLVSALALCFCYSFFSCVIGVPLMGGFQAETGTLLLLLAGNLLAVAAYCSLFTLIEMLTFSRTGAIVLTMLVFFGMLVLSTFLAGQLMKPEYISIASGVDESGNLIFSQDLPNPSYLEGPLRTVFQTIVNLLPTGQAFSLAGGGDESLPLLPLYSLGLIALTTGLGIWGFRKKDII